MVVKNGEEKKSNKPNLNQNPHTMFFMAYAIDPYSGFQVKSKVRQDMAFGVWREVALGLC